MKIVKNVYNIHSALKINYHQKYLHKSSYSQTFKDEISLAAGPLQTCASHGAGAEAAIHSMQQIFHHESTDAVLLIDASNAFNRINRAVGLHNIRYLCPPISIYVINTYRESTRLFVSGGGEILSTEGTTQGDPLAMPWYSSSQPRLLMS